MNAVEANNEESLVGNHAILERVTRKDKRMPKKKPAPRGGKPRCGLCGKTKNLTKTECCGNWICDDED